VNNHKNWAIVAFVKGLYITEIISTDSEFICDMCMEKFSEPDRLQEHRAKKHSAPTGI
jgi:hypothetical protein